MWYFSPEEPLKAFPHSKQRYGLSPARAFLPDPAFFGVLIGLGGCSPCSSPTAMMSTWISLWPSCCLSVWLGEEGRGRDRERDGGHTISASASARSRCSGVWECWWVRSDESRGKERSQAEQLNWERDCDERECISDTCLLRPALVLNVLLQ